jgi:hypothetical protein
MLAVCLNVSNTGEKSIFRHSPNHYEVPTSYEKKAYDIQPNRKYRRPARSVIQTRNDEQWKRNAQRHQRGKYFIPGFDPCSHQSFIPFNQKSRMAFFCPNTSHDSSHADQHRNHPCLPPAPILSATDPQDEWIEKINGS